jgi:hypothetical protein
VLETVRAPSPTFPTVEELPRSGVAPPPASPNSFAPLLYGGLALAAAAATLSLSVRLRPSPVRRPPTGGGMGSGQRLHRRPHRSAAAPAPAVTPTAGDATPIVAEVAAIEDFSAFLDALRTLSHITGVARARAERLQQGTAVYRLLLEPWMTPEEFVRLAGETLGRRVTIASD